jgi:hypothetical protein
MNATPSHLEGRSRSTSIRSRMTLHLEPISRERDRGWPGISIPFDMNAVTSDLAFRTRFARTRPRVAWHLNPVRHECSLAPLASRTRFARTRPRVTGIAIPIDMNAVSRRLHLKPVSDERCFGRPCLSLECSREAVHVLIAFAAFDFRADPTFPPGSPRRSSRAAQRP